MDQILTFSFCFCPRSPHTPTHTGAARVWQPGNQPCRVRPSGDGVRCGDGEQVRPPLLHAGQRAHPLCHVRPEGRGRLLRVDRDADQQRRQVHTRLDLRARAYPRGRLPGVRVRVCVCEGGWVCARAPILRSCACARVYVHARACVEVFIPVVRYYRQVLQTLACHTCTLAAMVWFLRT